MFIIGIDINNTQVYINGVYQSKDNYSTSGVAITFTTAPPTGAAIEVVNIIPDSTGGGISWESTVKTADFTATAGEGYFVNTTSSAITVTMPSSPSAGDEVSLVDYAGTADTNNITITSSNNINGSSDDLLINYERGGVSMVYVDATQGWIAYNAANETATALVSAVPLTVDYLVVAGGGSGGTYNGSNGSGSGGGGAGGLRTSYESTSGGGASAETALTLSTSTDYTVSIGAGGGGISSPSSTYSAGNNGANSVFSTITSTGGGGGGSGSGTGVLAGKTGGSGGGSGYAGSGGLATSSPVQGYDGGDPRTPASQPYPAGGGGGAGSVGVTASSNDGGAGGSGLPVSITSSTNTYSAGGSGSNFNAGSSSNAAVNTGNGSNGAATGSSGNGGSGVVIIRYPDTYTIQETTSGGNVLTFTTDSTTVANTKITTFTAGTSGTIQFS